VSGELTLAGDRWAPVTSRIGFLRAPLDDVAGHLQQWRAAIHGTADVLRLEVGLTDSIHRLEPLTGGVRPRELLVATRSKGWTAVFDCGVQGGDQVTTVGYLARTMLAEGVVVLSIPDRRATNTTPDRYGGRQFELFSPIATDFLNYTRTISVVRTGSRWRFDANGMVQDFEDVDAYRRRTIADRFTPQMLQRYAAALDLFPWDLDFYPGPVALVTNPATPPPNAWQLSITETQARRGIAPG
jgi:hypothetical protein